MENNYEIVFDKDSSKAAIECLMNMVELERMPNFGSLKNEYSKTNRYNIEEKNIIDSRYYTDKSTTLLFYAMELYGGGGAWFCENVLDLKTKFEMLAHDITDNSGELQKEDIEENNLVEIESFILLKSLYSGFEILNEKDWNSLINKLSFGLSEYDYKYILKKTDVINGVEKKFYYLASSIDGLDELLYKHEYYTNYIGERFPKEILNALSEKANGNDIILLDPDCCDSLDDANLAAYANSGFGSGFVVINSNFYDEAICHEIGHIFDNQVSNNCFYIDFNIMSVGIWDSLARNYASEIYTIRKGTNIGAGYSEKGMKENHKEFYAEAFQLYFYSPETRAALPQKIREQIEYEINRFVGDDK